MSKFIVVTEYNLQAKFASIDAKLKQHLKLGSALVDPTAVQAVRFVEGEPADRQNFALLVLPGTSLLLTLDDARRVLGDEVIDALVG